VNVRIPRWLVLAWSAFGDWVNVDVYKRIRRIDILTAFFFIICVSWYGYTSGWIGALTGGFLFLFIFIAMIALWFNFL